jgi:low temperature requirement protein LtrA
MTASSLHAIPEREYEVTPVELFFDLVFVFAVSQLSHYLLDHLSWRGAAETLVMLLAIFGAWFTTSWSATIVRADQSRTRWLILTVMLLGLFMNASVTVAFATSGWAFVIPLLLIQLGRAVWTFVNSTDTVFRDHYFRVLLWLIATTPLWIAGAAVRPEARVVWWALAAGLDTIGRWLAHPIPGRRLQSENVPFDASHMLERCRLFLLIALGETVFTTGTAIAAAPTTLMTLITGTVALAATVALWALNFGHSTRLTLYYREETSDPIRIGRYAVNALIVMVAGLIAVAVANEMVIAHPHGDSSATLSLLLYGGPLIYLVAQGWYLRAVPRNSPRLRLIGSAALVLVGFAALSAPRYLALILAGASLTTLAIVDQHITT